MIMLLYCQKESTVLVETLHILVPYFPSGNKAVILLRAENKISLQDHFLYNIVQYYSSRLKLTISVEHSYWARGTTRVVTHDGFVSTGRTFQT